ncbi:MAG: DUF4330 domain-containing protein [Oscillospiraceae bacterium]|nr:DUF4330 domain-containing protein [Oscillospiraceae bacterium]
MKAKHRFNGFDVFLIVVLVALVVGLVVKFGVLGSKTVDEKNGTPVTYTLVVTPVRTLTVDQLQVGDTLYYESTDTEMGVITDIQVEPATTTVTTSDGEVIQATYEDRYEVTLTISATCLESDGVTSGYQVGDITLLANRSDSYHTKYSSFSGTMISYELGE